MTRAQIAQYIYHLLALKWEWELLHTVFRLHLINCNTNIIATTAITALPTTPVIATTALLTMLHLCCLLLAAMCVIQPIEVETSSLKQPSLCLVSCQCWNLEAKLTHTFPISCMQPISEERPSLFFISLDSLM